MAILAEWQALWPAIAVGATAVVGLLTFVLTNTEPALDLWRRLGNRLRVVRITDETDPDLVLIDDLLATSFDERVADGSGELRRYLAESRRGRVDATDPRPYFLVFALKYRRAVCGFLSAEYFPHSRTIFLWHMLVCDTQIRPGDVYQKGAMLLLGAMSRAADATGLPWQHVLTEIEAAPADLRRARAKMQLFQNAAKRISRQKRKPAVRVFRLPIDYRQPVLRVEFLADPPRYEVPEWLLYAPRQIGGSVREVDGRALMDRERAVELLDTLLLKSYARAFAYSAEYGRYCRAMFERQVSRLPERLELIENVRLAEPDSSATTLPAGRASASPARPAAARKASRPRPRPV